MKVLFVYPNISKSPTPQLGIASLSGVLKEANHTCDLFDITFLKEKDELYSFSDKLKETSPDLLAISARSHEWRYVASLLDSLDDKRRPFVVVGGACPTVAPEKVIAHTRVDAIVIGEGEEAIRDLCESLSTGRSLEKIGNLWMKNRTEVVKNEVRPFIQELDSLPVPDWELFDRRHYTESLVRAFGEFDLNSRKKRECIIGVFETSRGCPHSCTYCINPHLQTIYHGKGRYHREKLPERTVREIEVFKERFGLDYVYFIDETLLVNTARLKDLCSLYKERIHVPFFFLAWPGAVNEERIKIIADAGAQIISMGIESGDEEFRKDVLNRKLSQEELIQAFSIARKYGIKTVSYNIIGFPFEKRGHIQKTLELNNRIRPDVVQVSIFAPYEGTILRQKAIEHGFLDSKTEIPTSYYKGTILSNFHDLTPEKISLLNKLISVFANKPRVFLPLVSFFERYSLLGKGFLVLYFGFARAKEIPRKVRQFGINGFLKKVFRDFI